MTRTIIDNALDFNSAKMIKEEFFRKQFPWFYINLTLTEGVQFDHKKEFNFHHIICGYQKETTPAIRFVQPIFDKLNVAAIFLCRVFLTTYTGENVNHGFHVDALAESESTQAYRNMNTAIYYVHTNNGGTLFEDGQFVNSVENRLLVFNSQERHAAITATDVAARIVVNINYF